MCLGQNTGLYLQGIHGTGVKELILWALLQSIVQDTDANMQT